MTIILRLILTLVSIITFVVVVKKIRNAKVQIEYSLFWIIFAVGLLLFCFFPELATFASQIIGIYTPVNFVFLFVIFVLLVHQFFNSIKISQLENKINELTQELAIRELVRQESEKENK